MLSRYLSPTSQAEIAPVIIGAYIFVLCPGNVETKGDTDWVPKSHRDVASCDVAVDWTVTKQTADWLKFQALASKWRTERRSSSSITQSAMCASYQAIIGMGATAVPFILSQLKAEGNDPDQWFWALRAITGENPVADSDRGNFGKMAKAWLGWAEKNGW